MLNWKDIGHEIVNLEKKLENQFLEFFRLSGKKHEHHHHHHHPRHGHHYPGHHDHDHDDRQKVRQVLIAIINHQKFIIMDPLKLVNGKQAPVTPGLVDAFTLAPIPGASFVYKARSVDDASVAKIDENGQLVSVGVGSAKLTETNTWTYEDQNTHEQNSHDETTIQDIQVTVTPEGVLQVVGLGEAVPIPAPAQ